jgi:hypothetical protein
MPCRRANLDRRARWSTTIDACREDAGAGACIADLCVHLSPLDDVAGYQVTEDASAHSLVSVVVPEELVYELGGRRPQRGQVSGEDDRLASDGPDDFLGEWGVHPVLRER